MLNGIVVKGPGSGGGTGLHDCPDILYIKNSWFRIDHPMCTTRNWEIHLEKRPLAGLAPSSQPTEAAPADWPNRVTREGSPLKLPIWL